MSTVQIYDKAMCCSTGVCGPDVDPVLPKFAADLDWLKAEGNDVSRYNLAQDPAEFVSNALVKQMLDDQGVECLPVIIVDGRIVSQGDYPSRQNLALWSGTTLITKPSAMLPIADQSDCSGQSGCC
ncbi:MAG: arsenite efflux transporter metallochaperone ArsD [Fuerstiella sp.]